MMSILKRPINYVGLEYELEESLKADTKYQLENDAKLRAIEQNVPTYEHFRQMVNGAHLRPLVRKDTKEATEVSWNLLTRKNNIENAHTSLKRNSSLSINNGEQNSYVYKSVKVFHEKWRAIDVVEDKIKFLLHARDLLPEIFHIEIPSNILCEFLNVCLHALTIMEDQCSSLIHVIDILTSLTTCNRFQLAITFMTIHDKSVCHQLFEKILFYAQNGIVEPSTIVQLGKKFQVIL